ncbi:hypothetical protein [Nocardia gamkensis]|uniref:Uncharacterized protein n=1 Tax=Nocardia gamkensis TaxID=352869 RepID=A0A7X6L234_9NOCA|nr:hypothetical protein [Nocardia gamkensis]NKY26436.1 hypothetical protein [Nocardia gamkensis]
MFTMTAFNQRGLVKQSIDGDIMITNKMRATAAAVALTPIIALGSGIASAAPDVTPGPVQVGDQPVPVQVEPATLGLIWPLGIFCAPLLLLPPVVNAVAVFVCAA